MTRRPLSMLVLALVSLLVFGAYIASRETVPAERGFDLMAIACAPAEPPMSRLGCAP